MKRIGTRLAVLYAIGATISFAILSLLGGSLMIAHMIGSLDALNAAEFRQLQRQIGPDFATVGSRVLETRLKSVDQYQSVLFYVSIDSPQRHEHVFRSQNLRGREIPDVKGQRAFNAATPGLGSLRVGEFLLPPYDVTVATSAQGVDEVVRAFTRISVGLIFAMLVVSLLLGGIFARYMLEPIRAIRATADRIGSNNLVERIPLGPVRDEVDELAELLNRMFDRLEDAFAQMRRFSSEVSHELKTPLSLLRLHAESIAKSGAESAITEAAVEQIGEIARLNTFIDQMLFLSRAQAKAIAFDLKTIDPREFLITFAHDAEALAEHSGRRFVLDARGAGEVGLEQSWFRQVLLNLFSNALHVTPPDGEIRLISRFAGDEWIVSIEDEGPGLDSADCERIFERFVQLGTKARGDRGAGLGLSIAQSIVTLHGGVITAHSLGSGRGLGVTVRLPQVLAPVSASLVLA